MKQLHNVLVILAIFLLITNSVFAGTSGKIAGKVTSLGESLPIVNVIIKDTKLGAMTDDEGNYYIINVPVGKHTLCFSMMGYEQVNVKEVIVNADYTTIINQELQETTDWNVPIVVTAKRKLINQSITQSVSIIEAEMMAIMPVDKLEEAIILTTPGIVKDNEDQIHIRGGRASEILYMVDGMAIVNPLLGSKSADIPKLAVKEISITAGGFAAEYGDAQSGIINIITYEGKDEYHSTINYHINLFDISFLDKYSFVGIEDWENDNFTNWKRKISNIEYSLSGPVPLINRLPNNLGKMNFFISGNYNDNNASMLWTKGYEGSFTGKLTYINNNATCKINASFFSNWYGRTHYDNRWRRKTKEDCTSRFKDTGYGTIITYYDDGTERPESEWDIVNNNTDYIEGWYANGQLDGEDINGDNRLNTRWYDNFGNLTGDTRIYEGYDNIDYNNDGDFDDIFDEDLNRNGILDSEDLNANSKLDNFNMLDNLAYYKGYNNELNLSWTHTLSKNTYYEIKLNHTTIYDHSNTKEQINEDRDGDGNLDVFDPILYPKGEHIDVNNDGVLEPFEWDDINGDGTFDPYPSEDLNGNGMLDDPYTDLFTDYNNNGIIDASEGYDEIGWEDIPCNISVDSDGFYTYGNGTNYPSNRWKDTKQQIFSMRFDLTSQINKTNQIKSGFEGKYFHIRDYNIDLFTNLEGVNDVYGNNFNVFPHSISAYIQDKIESEGVILNLGMRLDYFNPNYDNYPNDLNDPTIDPDIGGEIKNPKKINSKMCWSPRIGISFPANDKSKLYFSYGRYFQMPMLYYVYRNLNFDFKGEIIGNPNLQPELTSAYEIGTDYLFNDYTLFTITGFYKHVTGLTSIRSVICDTLGANTYYNADFYTSDSYAMYYNTDYADVSGFEFTLKRIRRSIDYWSANIVYIVAIFLFIVNY